MIKRVLLVEDHEDNRRIVREVLTSAGIDIIEAIDGEQGLALARSQFPDLILMDIQLPIIDGYEATRKLKADPVLRSIPVIAVTSYALDGDDARAFDAGCVAYVTKPFSPRQLLAVIRDHLT